MADMTEEQYNALDEEFTRTVPKLGPNGTGFLSQKARQALVGIDHVSENYLMARSLATNKTPGQVINEIIHEKITNTKD